MKVLVIADCHISDISTGMKSLNTMNSPTKKIPFSANSSPTIIHFQLTYLFIYLNVPKIITEEGQGSLPQSKSHYKQQDMLCWNGAVEGAEVFFNALVFPQSRILIVRKCHCTHSFSRINYSQWHPEFLCTCYCHVYDMGSTHDVGMC